MTVEFEKLSAEIQNMGEAVLRRQQQATQLLLALRARLHEHATHWAWADECLKRVAPLVDEKFYRSARPLRQDEALDQGIDPPPPPARATLLAVDGSQRLPTRHDPFLYYLLNIGVIIYRHGETGAPETTTAPKLVYPSEDMGQDVSAEFTPSNVSIQRDLAEINQLAHTAWKYRSDTPVLAVLDQRLQYWPIGSGDQAASGRIVAEWIAAMDAIQHSGSWLVGYIERPETSALINLLYALDWGQPDFDPARLNQRPPVTDADVYRPLLQPGQRTPVFEVINPSGNYQKFVEAGQSIGFFYFRPPQADDLARVDVPLWAARQPGVIEQIHALLHDQCRILGRYPYILTRADEIAVVQTGDQEYLDNLIALELQRRGITGDITGKQWGKEWTRAAKSRHAV